MARVRACSNLACFLYLQWPSDNMCNQLACSGGDTESAFGWRAGTSGAWTDVFSRHIQDPQAFAKQDPAAYVCTHGPTCVLYVAYVMNKLTL
jgi:hypothetical protein